MKSFLKKKKGIADFDDLSSIEFAERLLGYDVVSFDIFDTLIFRPFNKPDDLFFHMGQKIGVKAFAKARIKAEAKARSRGEVTLEDIYENMKPNTADKEKLMAIEQEIEIDLCYANTYMQEVFNAVRNCGKPIIIISDMYLSSDTIKKMLERCGYTGYSELFVSCECGVSKHTGELYEVARQKTGEIFSYIHIGDNEYSDVTQAKEHGFEAVHYSKEQ